MTQKIQAFSIIVLIACAGLVLIGGLGVPEAFPEGARFTISEGESLQSVSKRLEDEHIISSAFLFRGWISTLGQDKDIELGVYEFNTRIPLSVVIAKIVSGPDEPLFSVTIPEGYTTKEVADAFAKMLPNFRVDRFGELVVQEGLDGYLFPSTYYPLPSHKEEDIISMMKNTFEREYKKQFSTLAFPKYVPTRNDVISLASIIEGEAKTKEDMKIVSGILQKRLERGMRLQVDVAEVTYRESGLPDQPINNPGSVAIDAVFHPKENPYLYYITGNDGTMHYAKTFEEHKRNIQKYLK